ncbi:hypothetical protein [Halomonas sp.]|uniref:hypothetical protein n=1 Tax=Halomonas sp. TaxID=1486246 RepID=UPI00356AED50
MRISTFAGMLVTLVPAWGMAQAPVLPSGLGSSSPQQTPPDETATPSLPAGLDGGEQDKEQAPALPTGLDGSAEASREDDDPTSGGRWLDNVTGFWDLRAGSRLQDDPAQDEAFVLGEARLQLSRTWYTDAATTTVTGDFLYDPVAEEQEVDLETGQGWFDLREANVLLRPLDAVDAKIGRQVLTWGVGDLVFLNDLFPKDFVSFFNGRDVEYLKAPSDAVRVSLFGDAANLDLVYTPRFDPDRFITGERLSWFNPVEGRVTGDDAVISPAVPGDWFNDDEIAARLYRNAGAFELAAYAYNGFWKDPMGMAVSGELFFPALSVYGTSLRGPGAGGIVSAEFAYYDSREDRAGDDPRLPNSQWRTLVGFERELLPEFTAGVQYYTEITDDFGALRDALPQSADAGDRIRHTLTLRLTKLAMNQRLTLSAFNFWSPSADDGHLRFTAGYKVTDDWLVEAGVNAFYGPDETSFFGQLKDNTNAFVAVRRGF